MNFARRIVAEPLLQRGLKLDAEGRKSEARRYYERARKTDPAWSVPWYNLGLMDKYAGNWQQSFVNNKKASELAPSDEAAKWNLGIAATALRNWEEAVRAWESLGIKVELRDGQVAMPPVSGCVRLNPNEDGEVVWGRRIDPARTVILSIPLPESHHRYHDIVLNDGAENGRRRDGSGHEVPVFDELQLWRPSDYSTFEAEMSSLNEAEEVMLRELCAEAEVGVEDWSTIRIICSECSRGNPGAHDCRNKPSIRDSHRYALAAKSESEVKDVLMELTRRIQDATVGKIRTLLKSNSVH